MGPYPQVPNVVISSVTHPVGKLIFNDKLVGVGMTTRRPQAGGCYGPCNMVDLGRGLETTQNPGVGKNPGGDMT